MTPTLKTDALLADVTLAALEEDLAAVLTQMAGLDAQANLLRLWIKVKQDHPSARGAGSVAPSPSASAPKAFQTDERPTLRDAITRLLGERPGYWWRLGEIFSELQARGWAPRGTNGRNQTSARLSKLVDAKIVQKRGLAGSSEYAVLLPGAPPK